jgi:hypothetical protein
MAGYNAYSQAWLEDQRSIRSLFVVVTLLYDSSGLGTSYTSTPLYFSTDACITTDGLISFNPVISGDISLTESISMDGSTSMSFGDISLNNLNGELDAYLDNNKYIWGNQSIQIYLGDPTWSMVSGDFITTTTKFKLVFNGVVDDIDSKSRTELNIKLRDKLDKLNNPLTESKLGIYGSWVNSVQNADTIKPLVFGEVFNMTPLLIDPNNGGGQYMVNDGPVNQIIEIRDNGIPIYQQGSTVYVGATVAPTLGTFILTYPPNGAITASVQGVNNSISYVDGSLQTGIYSNTIAKCIALIATQYGVAASRLNAATELDLTNFSAFNTACPQPVGIVITDTTNVLNVIQALATSVGAQVIFTREGKLQILQFGVGITSAQDSNITIGNTTATPITAADIVFDTINISMKVPFSGAFKLGFCKNWTVQDSLVTALPADHKSLFATEWMTVTSTASATLISNYKLNVDPQQIDTMLLVSTDASAEASRRITYYTTQRFVYKFTGVPKLFGLRLGQQVYLSHNRFNLYNSGQGKLGQVITLSPNWTSSLIDVEVII